MAKILLEGLEFFAYHGYHQEERKTGNRYNVDVLVEADVKQAAIQDQLKETIDYAKLYQTVKEEMEQPAKLLEHIGYRIIQQILEEFPQVTAVEVQVSKFNPPLGGVCRRACVTLREERPL
uniref:7,8-dihydroneopterin aldolase n=1 Tax=Roseihalotalea indica TaxID=2867963 RepID=A0AA49GR66_9BACT|nr:dihydroneopterin aldolase [Tunicatimonas sp. TK19036]